VWNFKEIYNLLKNHKVSNKITTSNQLCHKVDQLLANKKNSNNLELKIKNLGNKILNLTLNEINFYMNR